MIHVCVALFCFFVKQQYLKMLSIVNFRGLFQRFATKPYFCDFSGGGGGRILLTFQFSSISCSFYPYVYVYYVYALFLRLMFLRYL